jgi:hypothetical protein
LLFTKALIANSGKYFGARTSTIPSGKITIAIEPLFDRFIDISKSLINAIISLILIFVILL